MRAAVLGCGSWGTALSIVLARNGHSVVLLGRSADEIDSLVEHRENLRYLPGFVIAPPTEFSLMGERVPDVELWVIAVPSVAVREVCTFIEGEEGLVVVASKGLEPATAMTPAQVAQNALARARVGAMSGPNLAVEVVRGVPSVAVAAFRKCEDAQKVVDAFAVPAFRVSASDDIVGVELGGALKNVLAIGAGMSDGLGFGDNTKGAFLSRGLMEIARIGATMGARAETFLGPTGVGDLFATASSKLSRNYRVGRAIGEGQSLAHALNEVGQVAEGVTTCAAAQVLSRKHEVDTPVLAAVDAVIRGRFTPKQVVAKLMERGSKASDFA